MLRILSSLLIFITATGYAMAATSDAKCGVSGTLKGSEYCLYCKEGDPTATTMSFGDDVTCTCAGNVPCAILIDGKEATLEEYVDLMSD